MKQVDLKELRFILARGVRWVFSFDAFGQDGIGHHCGHFMVTRRQSENGNDVVVPISPLRSAPMIKLPTPGILLLCVGWRVS